MHDSGMYQKLRFMVTATIIFSVILLVLLIGWSWYPYQLMDTEPEPFPVVYPENKIVEQGSYITYEFKYNKTTKIIPVVQRQFVDGLVFNVAGTQTPTVVTRGEGTARVQVEIPETLPPGNYQLRIIATYQVNPIREIQNIHLTEKFEVISGRSSDAEQGTVLENAEGRE